MQLMTNNKPGDKFRRARINLMRNDRAIMERSHILALRRVEKDHPFPKAATDGVHLFVNVEWFETMPEEHQQFVLLHEARHRMLKHPIRFKEMVDKARPLFPKMKDEQFYFFLNKAADYRINADLIADGWSRPKEGWYYEGGKYNGWSVFRIFMDLLKEEQEQQDKGGGQPDKGFDQCQGLPGTDGKEATGEEKRTFDQKVDNQNETALAMAKKRGTVPGSMKELIKESKPAPDWDKQLPSVLSRVKNPDDYSMARISNPGRRMRMVMPSVVGTTIEHIVIGIDTSGSITAKDLSAYLSKINSIVKVENPIRVTIIQVDARVQDVMEMSEGETLPTINVKGRGGTAFQPLFDYVTQQGWSPDCVVYLTDGMGDRPRDPGYPVIWITTRQDPAPWGTIIRIDA